MLVVRKVRLVSIAVANPLGPVRDHLSQEVCVVVGRVDHSSGLHIIELLEAKVEFRFVVEELGGHVLEYCGRRGGGGG